MKKVLCWLMCAVMLLSAAACGKTPEKTMPDTAEPAAETTTVPETEAPKTDQNAKAEDVVKEALKALMKEDLKFGFTSDTALDLSLLREEGESKAAQSENDSGMGGMIGMIRDVVFGDKTELNLKMEAKAEGSADMQKGMAAKVEVKNNLAEALEGLISLLSSETEGESPISQLKDTIKTEVYLDKAEEKFYFLNPATEEWNYSKAEITESEDAEKTIDELELEKIFGKDYEWKITNTQYLLNADVDLKELALNSVAEEDRKDAEEEIGEVMDGLVLHVALTFNDEKKLESAELSLDPVTKDLNMFLVGIGISLRLNRFEISSKMDYAAAVDCEVPAAVKESATEAEGGLLPIGPDDPYGPDEPDVPWANDEYDLKDEVLADDENLKLTAKEVQMDEFGDLQVLFTLENKTDKKLTVDLDDFYLNGLKASGFIYEDADPQSTIDFALDIYDIDMNEIHQEHIYQLDLFFVVEDGEDWSADPLLEDHFTLNVQTGEAEPWEQDPEMKLLETEDLEAYWVTETEEDKLFGGTYLHVYCENGKDLPVSFEITDLKINGLEVESIYWEDEIKAGFAGMSKRSVPADFLKDNAIDKITEVTGTIRAYSEDADWNETEYAANTFTVSWQDDGSVSLETAAAE